MLDIPIVDSHLHVWDTQRLSYPWLTDMPGLNTPHLPEHFHEARGPVRVEKVVFVQAECDFTQYREEVDWVTCLAQRDGRIAGIVSWAALEQGHAVRAALELLAANPLVKGVRRIIQVEPDPEFCLQPEFISGVRMLPEFDMNFDVCIAHHQLPNTIRFVRQCPDVRFVLDHIGKPDIKRRQLDPWRSDLKSLAAMENVWCKISGLATEADHKRWTNEDLKPYIDHVLECFGFDRVMFGGDWPVALLATDYPRWVETLQWAVEGCSDHERRKLFHDNAIVFYRLGDTIGTPSTARS